MTKGILILIICAVLPASSAIGDPPLKLFPENFEAPKHDDPPPKETLTKICLPCQGIRQVSGYARSISTAEELQDHIGVDFTRNENGTSVSKPKLDLHHRGVSYLITDTLSFNVKKTKAAGTTGDLEKSIVTDQKAKAKDFSKEIIEFRSRSTDDN